MSDRDSTSAHVAVAKLDDVAGAFLWAGLLGGLAFAAALVSSERRFYLGAGVAVVAFARAWWIYRKARRELAGPEQAS